jgi:hypothetical protein
MPAWFTGCSRPDAERLRLTGRPDGNRTLLVHPPGCAKRRAQHEPIGADRIIGADRTRDAGPRLDRNAPADAGILVSRRRRASDRRVGLIPTVIVANGSCTVGNASVTIWRLGEARLAKPDIALAGGWPGSAGRHLLGRPYRQLQDLAQRGQVFVTRPTVVPLPKIDAGRADAHLFCNFCNRQTTLDPSVTEITCKIWLTRQ